MAMYNQMFNADMMAQGQDAFTDVVGTMTPRPQAPINPRAFSNGNNISSMFGQSMPNTYNRSIGASPFMQSSSQGQMTSQGYVPGIDPTNPSMQPQLDAIQASTGMPIAPPTGVQQSLTPTYDLSNQ